MWKCPWKKDGEDEFIVEVVDGHPFQVGVRPREAIQAAISQARLCSATGQPQRRSKGSCGVSSMIKHLSTPRSRAFRSLLRYFTWSRHVDDSTMRDPVRRTAWASRSTERALMASRGRHESVLRTPSTSRKIIFARARGGSSAGPAGSGAVPSMKGPRRPRALLVRVREGPPSYLRREGARDVRGARATGASEALRPPLPPGQDGVPAAAVVVHREVEHAPDRSSPRLPLRV